MAWRTVYITRPAKLSVSNGALLLTRERGESKVNIPFDDIAVIIIENPQVVLTAGVLRQAAESGTVVVGCDAKQHPCGVFLPFHRHSRTTAQLRVQLSWSAPFKKRLHRQLIKNKVYNQGCVLRAHNPEAGEELIRLAQGVMSGDKTHIEAHAAAKYFKALFNEEAKKTADNNPPLHFTREAEVVQNAALNYGYAILRAALARAVVAYGLNPALGLFHDSELNAYNLADDLLEPFRPLVDNIVKTRWHDLKITTEENFGVNERKELVNLLNATVITVRWGDDKLKPIANQSESRSVLSATEELVKSLVTAGTNKNADELLYVYLPAPLGPIVANLSHKAE